MTKLKLPKAQAHHRDGISFELAPGVLSRWNAAVVAKDEAEGDKGDATISIYDAIGQDPWTGEGVTSKRIAAALRSVGKRDVVVNINSPGGNFFEGIAIYNLLRDHPAKVTTRVVGLAASAASVIAMAGDEIQIAKAGWLMVHNAMIVAIGNRNDLREAADWIEQFDKAMADLYAARTGLEVKAVAKLMDAETYFAGEDAIERGFADALVPADQVEEQEEDKEASAASVRSIDMQLARHGVPRAERRALINRMKELGKLDAAEPKDPAMPRAAPEENATHDAGAAAEVTANLTNFFADKLAAKA